MSSGDLAGGEVCVFGAPVMAGFKEVPYQLVWSYSVAVSASVLTPCRCLCVLLSLPQKPQVGFVGGTSSVAKTRANVAAGANSVEHVQVLLLRARICVTR